MSDIPMGQLVSYKKIEMEKNYGQERLSQCDDNTSHDGLGDLIKTVWSTDTMRIKIYLLLQ